MGQKTAPHEPVDLSSFDGMVQRQEEGILVRILGPDGKTPLGFSIRVAGPDSEIAQAALDAIQQEVLEQESLDAPTQREIAQRRLSYFAKVTMDFVADAREDGVVPDVAVKLDGAPLPCSEENATKLYQRFKFILAQVRAKADTRSAFLNG